MTNYTGVKVYGLLVQQQENLRPALFCIGVKVTYGKWHQDKASPPQKRSFITVYIRRDLFVLVNRRKR